MATQNPRRKARKNKKPVPDRVEELVQLQKDSIAHWSDYATRAAGLMANGTMNAEAWMKEYSGLSKNVADDMGKLARILFPSRRR